MRAQILLPLIGLTAFACDGQFSTPNGHPVPLDRDTRDSATDTNRPVDTAADSVRPDAAAADSSKPADTASPQDTNRPPSDTANPQDTNRPPSDTANPRDTASGPGPNDTSSHDTSPPQDTGPGPSCDPDYYACTASEDLEYCDGGSVVVANCGSVCRDSGYAFTTGCGYDDNYGGDVCWCDDVEGPPPTPTCNANACADSCIARGYEPGACTNGACQCGAPLPPAATCNPGWSCQGETLAYCDGASTQRWSCDDFCRGEGYAFASACGWDPSLGDEACFCEDDACTGGADICLGSDYLETCTGSGVGTPVTVDCWDVCQDAGYDSVAGCGADGNSDACFCHNEVCGAGQLTCSDGRCLDNAYICDGIADCASGDDEWGCPATCIEGDSVCISGYELEVCGGGEQLVYDCDDFCRSEGFDYAEGCGYDAGSGFDSCYCAFEVRCESWEFQCDDGLCLDEVYTCDGVLDCTYGEDESGCMY